MPAQSIQQLLDRLDELKRPAAGDERERARLSNLLKQLARRRFAEAESLIRFHEILLFMRAYPRSATHLRETEKLLHTFAARVERLRADNVDLSPFERPEVSGIVGTGFDAMFGYDIVRWLAHAHPSSVNLAWDDEYENRAHLSLVWPRFLPLFEEDAYVDAHVPFLEWLSAAKRRGESDLAWLVRQFERLPVGDKEKAELFDPLKLWVRWEFKRSKATRTLMRLPARKIFYHEAPLLGRRDVSLERELKTPPMPVEKLSREEGERVLALGRDTMAARFRELHGFTYGDPRHVLRADAGRGLEIYVWGVEAERRLPLLGYHAGMLVKNGVPIGYHEGLSLFERVETGVNLFYTFRDGESAWTYARLMRLYRQLFGHNTFSIDPYQLGAGNEEGIESGSFWFYRKLGFRPTRDELSKLVAAEEKKIAARKNYRTPPRTLRRLASGHVIFESSETAASGEWDNFRVRNIGLAVQRRMSERFDADAQRIRAASVKEVTRALDVGAEKLNEWEARAFSNYALVLALVPGLARWPLQEKRELLRIIRAKAGADELVYLRLLRRHARLRRAIIALGTNARVE